MRQLIILGVWAILSTLATRHALRLQARHERTEYLRTNAKRWRLYHGTQRT